MTSEVQPFTIHARLPNQVVSKKILHLIGQLGRGGAERQMISVCVELQKRGWDQSIATFDPGRAWDEKISEAGIGLLKLPRHPVPAVRLWRLHQLVRRERPQLIHSWSLHTNVYASYLPFNKSRLVLSFRENPTIDTVEGTPRRLRHAWIYHSAGWVLSNSRKALADAHQLGILPKRESVVGNIVNLPSAKPKARPTNNCVVAVGSLKPLKGHRDLLDALAILARDKTRCTLLLAGDGPQRSQLQELAARLNIEKKVSFLGEIEDVASLMGSGNILVHPSYSEGLSNSILEGMAAGLAIVATSVGATPEFIEDGKTGFLVPPGRPRLLAEKIRVLLTEPELRFRLGQAAMKKVRAMCNPEHVMHQYEQVYNALLT